MEQTSMIVLLSLSLLQSFTEVKGYVSTETYKYFPSTNLIYTGLLTSGEAFCEGFGKGSVGAKNEKALINCTGYKELEKFAENFREFDNYMEAFGVFVNLTFDHFSTRLRYIYGEEITNETIINSMTNLWSRNISSFNDTFKRYGWYGKHSFVADDIYFEYIKTWDKIVKNFANDTVKCYNTTEGIQVSILKRGYSPLYQFYVDTVALIYGFVVRNGQMEYMKEFQGTNYTEFRYFYPGTRKESVIYVKYDVKDGKAIPAEVIHKVNEIDNLKAYLQTPDLLCEVDGDDDDVDDDPNIVEC